MAIFLVPVFKMQLTSSNIVSSTRSESVSKNTIGLFCTPAILNTFFNSSRKSLYVYPLTTESLYDKYKISRLNVKYYQPIIITEIWTCRFHNQQFGLTTCKSLLCLCHPYQQGEHVHQVDERFLLLVQYDQQLHQRRQEAPL